MSESCASCRFFDPGEEFDSVTVGFCRRRPPRLMGDGGLYQAFFPRVMATAWCGEYDQSTPVWLERVAAGDFGQLDLSSDAT